MRKIKLSFSLLIISLAALVPGGAFAANVDDFYFEDFVGDYYLSRDAEGVSRLKVVESLTAVFPDYKQNKGICRMIPFTNQNDMNVTLPDLSRANLKLTRNGRAEPIYSIEKENNYYEVCTGDESYVLGKQVYVFEYEFNRVVTDFSDYQELYWDTNGNGWIQRFENVTARVHFTPDVFSDYTGNSWCYVGKYGKNEPGRCTISEISDGVKFEAKKLARAENLTFDVEFKPGSFVVPEPADNFSLVFMCIGFLIVCVLLLISPIKKNLKMRSKIDYYNKLFVKPEFTPDKNYSVVEMAEIYIGKKKDEKVAVLLDMIVNHQIMLVQKGETKLGGKKWAVKILNIDEISKEGMCLLKILAGGNEVSSGEEVEIKTRAANQALMLLINRYKKAVAEKLKADELVENGYKKSYDETSRVWIVSFLLGFFMIMLLGIADDSYLVGRVVWREYFEIILISIFVLFVVIRLILTRRMNKFLYRTKKGLLASRYMDGLKLYIEMAEKDRLAFLQSVKGAEITPDGVVKLYEKLLPYAAVLGLEESWMKELEKYYQLAEVKAPDWYIHDFTAYSILRVVDLAATTVRYSTTYASSGGSSSSGFSGGGGGGFSGGGGGGGGGHGR